MAKLKSSFTTSNSKKLPAISAASVPASTGGRIGIPRGLSPVSSSSASPLSSGLNFGALHTKTSAVVGQTGSQWMSLLNSATGGSGGLLGGGLLSSGGFGFVTKLLNLFGGGKSSPAAPVAFQSPVSQHRSINITSPGAASSVTLGVNSAATDSHPQVGSTVPSHAQSAQVVQIVKQALLTSSSLNDVISEI